MNSSLLHYFIKKWDQGLTARFFLRFSQDKSSSSEKSCSSSSVNTNKEPNTFRQNTYYSILRQDMPPPSLRQRSVYVPRASTLFPWNVMVKKGVVMGHGWRSVGNPYPVLQNRCSMQGRLFFLICEALQLYPDIMRQTSVKRLKRTVTGSGYWETVFHWNFKQHITLKLSVANVI